MKLKTEHSRLALQCLTTNLRAGKSEVAAIQIVADFLTNTYRIDPQEAHEKASKLYRGYLALLDMKSEVA